LFRCPWLKRRAAWRKPAALRCAAGKNRYSADTHVVRGNIEHAELGIAPPGDRATPK
jgi:hypothetical protein